MLTLATRRLFSSGGYDLVVVGGGPGGYVAAIKAAQLGMKTACVEKRGALGGTCLNVGCIPSKALLNISHKYEEAGKAFKSMGLYVDKIDVKWDETLKKKDKIVKGLTSGIEHLFKKNKVEYIKGHGRFTSPTSLQVESSSGNSVIQSKNFIVATGSEPIPFPGLPFDQKIILSSTGALQIPKIPQSLVVIGGGVIGLELGSVYARMGSQVTVIEYLDQICPFLDSQIAKSFSKIMSSHMKMLVGHKVVSGKNLSTKGEVTIQPVKGGPQQTLTADHILVCTGRRPFTDSLGLDKAGVKQDQKGRIIVNDHLQSNIPNIFAIGDVIRGPMLAHKSEEEGIAAVQHMAGKGGHVNYDAIPGVIYTHPEVAYVGKTEEQLKKAGVEYSKGVFPFLANSRAKTNDDYEGLVKVLADKKTDKILGMHIVGVAAGEMIIEGVLSINYGASSQDIARVCHAHPTLSEAIKEACMATHDKAIHY